jgi:hypothetical protein
MTKKDQNKERQSKAHQLFVACAAIRWPETGDQEDAMQLILTHPKIRAKITWEANRYAGMNSELDAAQLACDIQTILYLAIRSEFTLFKDPKKMVGWLCARVGWRSLDHVTRECGLVYEKNTEGEGEYSRVEKVSVSSLENFSQDLTYLCSSDGLYLS